MNTVREETRIDREAREAAHERVMAWYRSLPDREADEIAAHKAATR